MYTRVHNLAATEVVFCEQLLSIGSKSWFMLKSDYNSYDIVKSKQCRHSYLIHIYTIYHFCLLITHLSMWNMIDHNRYTEYQPHSNNQKREDSEFKIHPATSKHTTTLKGPR